MLRRELRRRRMMRQLRRLDRLDARHGLGAPPNDGPCKLSERGRAAITLVGSTLALVGIVVAFGGVIPQSVASRIGLGDERLAEPPAAPASTSYRFLEHQPRSDKPVSWDPCRRIRYAVNPDGGPPNAEQLVRSAVGEVSRLTGLVFEEATVTDDRPDWGQDRGWPARSYDVLVSWATADEVPKLAGRTAGVGGPRTVGTNDGRQLRYAGGGVTLDADDFSTFEAMPHGRALQRAIILHELGHVVGLAHVDDPRQLMNADNKGLLDFGDGDRAGLARAGSGACF